MTVLLFKKNIVYISHMVHHPIRLAAPVNAATTLSDSVLTIGHLDDYRGVKW